MLGLPSDYKLLFRTVAGSHLYGTATETSDVDERGVFLAPERYWLGFLDRVEQVEDKKQDKVFYEFRKFLKLTLDCNPNMVELLFVPEDKWLNHSDEWFDVLKVRDAFLSKKAKHTFSGYAHSQLKRLKNHKRWMDGFVPTDKSEREAWELWKKNRNPERFALEEKFGYDTKHAAHLMRLMYEGKELLLTGNLTFPRPEAEFLVFLRNGYWSYDELMENVSKFDEDFERWYELSPLPHSPDRVRVNELCMDVARRLLLK
jgi:predicted nucleotidyltransferase